MSAALKYGIAFAAAALANCQSRHVARRWDTSQGQFVVARPGVIAVANPGAWSGGMENAVLGGFLDDLAVAAESLQPAGYDVAVSFRDTIRVTNPTTVYTVPGRRWDEPVGYYFVAPERPPYFAAGALNSNQLVLAFRGWQRAAPPLALPPPTASAALASAATLVLPLDSFPELPRTVRHVLDQRGCGVPELRTAQGRAVVQGRFARSDQTDWAVLCVRSGHMMVVVVWGQATPCPDAVAQTAGPVSGEIGLTVERGAYLDEPAPGADTAGTGQRYHDGIWVGTQRSGGVWTCRAGQWQPPEEYPD